MQWRRVYMFYPLSLQLFYGLCDSINEIHPSKTLQSCTNIQKLKTHFISEMSKLPDIPTSNDKKGRRQKRKSKPCGRS